jgi:hypothetical protein
MSLKVGFDMEKIRKEVFSEEKLQSFVAIELK